MFFWNSLAFSMIQEMLAYWSLFPLPFLNPTEELMSTKELMLLNCGVGEDSWESLGLQGDPTSPSWRKSVLNIHWKDWCWSWSSNILATWCKELTHWKRPCCWERLKAGGVGDDRGWDGWIASPTWWIWVWVSYGSWWWLGKPGVLQSIGSQCWTWLSDWTELSADANGFIAFKFFNSAFSCLAYRNQWLLY